MITSARNRRVAAARKLRRTRVRRQTGMTLIEGPFLLEEAAAAGIDVHDIFALESDTATGRICADGRWDLSVVTPDVMDGLASSVNPRGPVAVISVPPAPPLEPRDSVVLWDVADPGNAGAIIRTAGAFGFQVIATADTVDLWSPKVIRSAVGGHFRETPIEGVAADPARLISAGLEPCAAAPGEGASVAQAMRTASPVALLIGNEAHGLPQAALDAPGVTTFSIPMPGGTESLNAAVAAGIAMYLRMESR